MSSALCNAILVVPHVVVLEHENFFVSLLHCIVSGRDYDGDCDHNYGDGGDDYNHADYGDDVDGDRSKVQPETTEDEKKLIIENRAYDASQVNTKNKYKYFSKIQIKIFTKYKYKCFGASQVETKYQNPNTFPQRQCRAKPVNVLTEGNKILNL